MPTRLGWGFLLLLGGISFAAVNTGNNLLYLLVGIGLATLGVSTLSGGRALRQLDAEVSAPEEILASEPTAFVLTLRNRHPRLGSPAVLARLRPPGPSLPPIAVAPLIPGDAATRFLSARFPRRGLFSSGRLTLETTEPFGLVRRRRRLLPGGEFFVYPAPANLDAIYQEEAVGHRGDRSTRRIGEGLELHQIRPYQFDDDSRHIDWRASARLEQLMVKEFLEEGVERLTIAFDPGLPEDTPSGRRSFEREVSLAAALIYRCGARGVPFRFLAPEREFPMVDPPGGHRPVLEYLAVVGPEVRSEEWDFGPDLEGASGVVRLGHPGLGASRGVGEA